MMSKIIKRLSHFICNPMTNLQANIFTEVERGFRLNPDRSPDHLSLPENYGKNLPERVIEVLLTKLTYRPGLRTLDVGHANAMPCHLRMLDTLPPPRNLTGIDIALPTYDTRKYYRESIRGDITQTGFPENSFDLIWCISALEHFGMDNSQYTETFIQNVALPKKALHEMLRILAPQGNLLITVPYGKFENHSSHVNCDAAFLENLLKDVPPSGTAKTFYFKYTYGKGWVGADPKELAYVGYYDQNNSGAAGLAAIFIVKS
jgi:SAM-dependent methyltransferase